MKVPKRKITETVKLVPLNITFECPNGHRIVTEHLHFRKLRPKRPQSELRVIDEIAYPLQCRECGWKGVRHGRERVLLEPAERNRRTD
jgi:hypothetical protein